MRFSNHHREAHETRPHQMRKAMASTTVKMPKAESTAATYVSALKQIYNVSTRAKGELCFLIE